MIFNSIVSTVCAWSLCFIAGAWMGRPMFSWLGKKMPFVKG